MHPLPPAGGPYQAPPSVPLGRPAGAAPPPTPRDQFETSGPGGQSLIPRPTGPPVTASLATSPRPWPPTPESLPRASALTHLGQTVQGALVGSMGGLLAPLWGPELKPSPPAGPWDATPTADGWKVPRNPSRTPVRPHDLFEVPDFEAGSARLVSSLHGRLRALRLHWPEEFLEPAWSAHQAVFHDLTTRLPADVALHVSVEGLAGPALTEKLGEWSVPNPERIHLHPLQLASSPSLLYQPMTLWARDGALLMETPQGQSMLLLPGSFRGDGRVDPTLNRLIVQGSGAAPAALAGRLPELLVRRSELSFEGGDVICNGREILVGLESVMRTMADLKLDRGAVVERFQKWLGLPAVVVEPQPDFHLDLGFTFLRPDCLAVADPGETLRRLAGTSNPVLQAMLRITQDKQLAERYERAAAALRGRGYQIVRLPNLGGLGLTTPYVTYNNVLMENYPGVRRVYMPVYGLEELDEAARSVYREHGYQVVDMPSARLSTRLWGAIRCATGELQVTRA